MLIVIIVTTIVAMGAFTFFNNSIKQYFNLQQDGMYFGDMAMQSQRVSNVLRGLTDITTANADDLTVYAYFSPNDQYVSLVKYYKNAANNVLLADVTDMTADPPLGTSITSSLKIYTVIENFYSVSGLSLFEYLDSGGNNIPLPISDLHSIKGIRVNLAVPSQGPIANSKTIITSQVSLRNRKTNL
jgi:hypothetical protein